MEKINEKNSLQSITKISSSESFLSSLEIVINGRKNPDFIPYLHQTLSSLPLPLASFLFYALVYIHFHLLMFIIILRLIVEEYITKIEKIKNFQERFKGFTINKEKISNAVQKSIDVIKNIFLLPITINSQPSDVLINQEDVNTTSSNQLQNSKLSLEVAKTESQDLYVTTLNNSIDIENEKTYIENVTSTDSCEFEEALDEVNEKEIIPIIDDKKEPPAINQDMQYKSDIDSQEK